jgi:hypothetical protein
MARHYMEPGEDFDPKAAALKLQALRLDQLWEENARLKARLEELEDAGLVAWALGPALIFRKKNRSVPSIIDRPSMWSHGKRLWFLVRRNDTGDLVNIALGDANNIPLLTPEAREIIRAAMREAGQ